MEKGNEKKKPRDHSRRSRTRTRRTPVGIRWEIAMSETGRAANDGDNSKRSEITTGARQYRFSISFYPGILLPCFVAHSLTICELIIILRRCSAVKENETKGI